MNYYYFQNKGYGEEYHVMAKNKDDAIKFVKEYIKKTETERLVLFPLTDPEAIQDDIIYKNSNLDEMDILEFAAGEVNEMSVD